MPLTTNYQLTTVQITHVYQWPRSLPAGVPRVTREVLPYSAVGACTPARYSCTCSPGRFTSRRGGCGTQLYYRPPSLLRNTSPSRLNVAMTGLQGVSTVRKPPRRPRARGRAAADAIGEPMEFLVFNRSVSSCAVTGPLTLSFSPTTHPHTHPTNHSTTTTTHTPPRASSPILSPTPQMAIHCTEQERPPRERTHPATTAPSLAFHPARASSAGDHPAAGPVSHPAWAANAGNLPVKGPLSAAHGSLPVPSGQPRLPKSARLLRYDDRPTGSQLRVKRRLEKTPARCDPIPTRLCPRRR